MSINSDAVQERLVSMRYAYNTLVVDGGLNRCIKEAAVRYVIEHHENPLYESRYIVAVENKMAELKLIQVRGQEQEEYKDWLYSYLMILPADPFMALIYDLVISRAFSGEFASEGDANIFSAHH